MQDLTFKKWGYVRSGTKDPNNSLTIFPSQPTTIVAFTINFLFSMPSFRYLVLTTLEVLLHGSCLLAPYWISKALSKSDSMITQVPETRSTPPRTLPRLALLFITLVSVKVKISSSLTNRKMPLAINTKLPRSSTMYLLPSCGLR
jgi:hypothetical protein